MVLVRPVTYKNHYICRQKHRGRFKIVPGVNIWLTSEGRRRESYNLELFPRCYHQ
jgi:hypothetical protein